MDRKLLHKRITTVSLIIALLSVIGAVTGFLPKFIDAGIAPFSILCFIFSILSILSSYVIINSEKKWIRKATKYNLYIYPILTVAIIIILIESNNLALRFSLIAVLFIITFIFLLQIFIIADPISLTSTIIGIILIVCGILFKRFHLPLAGVILTVSLGLLSFGSFIYGIRSLYLAEKSTYLKYVGFLGSCVFTFSFLGLLFKLQHWPLGTFLVNIANYSFVLGTLTILLTLPASGFLDWNPFHKKVLRRLFLPYLLIFFLFILRYLLPEVNTFIFSSPQSGDPVGFEMTDYPVKNKNGL